MSDHPWCHLDAPDLTRLDLASALVVEALGDVPYLVGSCLTRPDYRDVDVRTILDDERFDALFPNSPHPNALRSLIEVAITEHYVKMTDLRVDYQIQRMSDANEKYREGVRHPLGIFPMKED